MFERSAARLKCSSSATATKRSSCRISAPNDQAGAFVAAVGVLGVEGMSKHELWLGGLAVAVRMSA